jgi:DMSO reductase anchor subunit
LAVHAVSFAEICCVRKCLVGCVEKLVLEGMAMLGTVLLVFAFVLAVIAAFVPGPVYGRWHLGWAAMAFYFASLLFGGLLGHLVR